MLKEAILNGALLGIIEDAARAMMGLTAGAEEAAFARSRLALPAVRRHVRTLVQTAANLPVDTRVTLERVDWDAWATVVHQSERGAQLEASALWFAARSLAPATLLWLATYRKSQPELFAFRA
ncbi:MAG: hypothetical protein JNJ44_09525 [Zoogloeaceae bacterium]|nr:hypothetical protein [Zoogloeaceae bacterium]